MEESGSENLDVELAKRKDTFLKDVDYVCISDNYWLGKVKPCLTYGLRGICYFYLEVESSTKDLHSGELFSRFEFRKNCYSVKVQLFGG